MEFEEKLKEYKEKLIGLYEKSDNAKNPLDRLKIGKEIADIEGFIYELKRRKKVLEDLDEELKPQEE